MILTSGSHLIRIEGLGNGGTDYTAFIDDVQVARVSSYYGFWDQGFISPRVRTNYSSSTQGQAGNPLTTTSPCPYFVTTDPLLANGCQTSPTTYTASNAFSLNLGSFTDTKFWVLVNNNEPAFNSCNSGPPDNSQPRSSPGSGIFGYNAVLDTAAGENFYRHHLVLNMNFTNSCGGGAIPYMSIGAHSNRGNVSVLGTANLGALNPTAGVPHSVAFTTKLYSYAPPSSGALVYRLVTVATWPDAQGRSIPRMIQLNLFHSGLDDSSAAGPGRIHWNWPIEQDTFYAGAEVVYFDAEDVQTLCGFPVYRMISSDVNKEIAYDIDLQALYKCASTPRGTENIQGFSNAMPVTSNLPITMVDWAVEGQATSGVLWPAVSNTVMH